MRVQALLVPVLLSVSLRGALASHCSNLDPYVTWIETWMTSCRPAGASGSPSPWFASCSWVSCECLWGSLEAPVPADELAPCFQQAASLDRLSQESKWFMTALMRSCKGTREPLSAPCGQCDRYRSHRPACSPTPAPAPPPTACNENLVGTNGNGYAGCQNVTRYGHTCQRWTDQSPQSHAYTAATPGLGNHSYCRNPPMNVSAPATPSQEGIWCFTTDPAIRWEYCDPIYR
mmetsp:Transcript_17480/g.52553  ORF Transcript_17480/g.52553 Transcript_17480/m.52553 type:complete len:232 (+) Transcript_17480:114-809(+)